MRVAVLTCTLDEELHALLEDESGECPVCGQHVEAEAGQVECEACGSVLERRPGLIEGQLELL